METFRPSLRAAARYIAFLAVVNLIWEVAQLPLYSIWSFGSPAMLATVTLHGTAGNLVIMAWTLGLGWLCSGLPLLTRPLPYRFALFTVASGAIYTAASEWWHTQIARTWSYSPLMPLIPGTPIGLSPVLEWIILPALALPLCFRFRSTPDATTSHATTRTSNSHRCSR